MLVKPAAVQQPRTLRKLMPSAHGSRLQATAGDKLSDTTILQRFELPHLTMGLRKGC